MDHTSSKMTTGIAEYDFKNSRHKAQWNRCTGKSDAPIVVFFHGEKENPASDHFCDNYSAQILLKNGYNVVAVNRPSFHESTGTNDLGGLQSVAASLAGIKMAAGSNRVIGFWGFDSGTIAAAFSAKSFPELKWLLLGNGFYDLEVIERQSKSEQIRKSIATQKATEGDAALERRSIAWDISGLPHLLAIYHAKNDDVAPKNQADAFNDQLRTAHSKVFFDEVEGIGHEIPEQAHFQIIAKALKNLRAN